MLIQNTKTAFIPPLELLGTKKNILPSASPNSGRTHMIFNAANESGIQWNHSIDINQNNTTILFI